MKSLEESSTENYVTSLFFFSILRIFTENKEKPKLALRNYEQYCELQQLSKENFRYLGT